MACAGLWLPRALGLLAPDAEDSPSSFRVSGGHGRRGDMANETHHRLSTNTVMAVTVTTMRRPAPQPIARIGP